MKTGISLGVTLFWKGARTPDDAALILQVLGFREIESGTWTHPYPLSLDDMTELYKLLRDESIRDSLLAEDKDCTM